jgi:hypothetical protein
VTNSALLGWVDFHSFWAIILSAALKNLLTVFWVPVSSCFAAEVWGSLGLPDSICGIFVPWFPSDRVRMPLLFGSVAGFGFGFSVRCRIGVGVGVGARIIVCLQLLFLFYIF